ncbi:MAG: XRE family transcriptional regulator [Acutalibacteraceae bacterium]
MSGRNNSTTISTIQKICDGLEITVTDFFDSPLFLGIEQEIK